MTKEYVIYKIEKNNEIIYIGLTCDIKRRQKQHSYLFKKGYKKELYDFIRTLDDKDIILIPIRSFKTKTDGKRYEMYLILYYYFSDKKLKQSVPSIRGM